jgi:L-glyceraldehyde 3-phosphate reductase
MWPGPYGDFGSRKYLVASCDQSLKRMGLEYVDIFYHHRPDPATPLEETVRALDYIVRSGRALYVGISSYSPEDTRRAAAMLKDLGTPLLIHQPEYSMLNRKAEAGLLDTLDELSVGCIVFSPLAQGLLTNKYLGGIPADSRATRERYLKSDRITPGLIGKISLLNDVAQSRDQTLAQMAIQWVFRHDAVSSALVGARNSAQLFDCLQALRFAALTDAELVRIDAILASKL